MPIDLENDATLNDATARLLEAEAAEPQMPAPAFEQSDDGGLQQTEAAEGATGKTPNESQSGTQATADKPAAEATEKVETQKPADKPADAKPDKGHSKSKFQANADRLDKTWKAVNEQKTQLAAKDAELRQREATIAQTEQRIKLESAKAKQKFTPDQYESTASVRTKNAEQLMLQADGLDKRAEQLETAGKFAESENAKKQAQDLRDQAAGEKYSAKQLTALAEQLRKNPDPTLEQHKATMAQHKQHYLVEAAKQWPDVAKTGSEFQKTMANHLQEIARQGIDPNENPVVFYHVARLVAAESAAARVPELEKKLGAAEAKVKELELVASPGGGQAASQRPANVVAMTDEQEEAELRAQAQQQS